MANGDTFSCDGVYDEFISLDSFAFVTDDNVTFGFYYVFSRIICPNISIANKV